MESFFKVKRLEKPCKFCKKTYKPQLPSTGESSYCINMSGGYVSIGDHSVTNVGTTTPR